MTNKELTIEAFKELIDKYKNPIGHIFGSYPSCPLCKIHHDRSCRGCPLARGEGWQGCDDFKSFPHVTGSGETMLKEWLDASAKNAFSKRAKFFEKYLPIIMEIPEEQFTKEGWKDFGFDIND